MGQAHCSVVVEERVGGEDLGLSFLPAELTVPIG